MFPDAAFSCCGNIGKKRESYDLLLMGMKKLGC
jgi:hypothetical protein